MSEPKYGLVTVGNALVDVLINCSEGFLKEQSKKHGVVKGAMTLIDEKKVKELYYSMPTAIEISGGTAANTSACFTSLGGKGAYIGKTADDQFGETFKQDMKSLGVTYKTQPLVLGDTTGRCLIMVTPDAERTMQTYLGAAT